MELVGIYDAWPALVVLRLIKVTVEVLGVYVFNLNTI